jgi:hypothetical protein
MREQLGTRALDYLNSYSNLSLIPDRRSFLLKNGLNGLIDKENSLEEMKHKEREKKK